MAMTKVQILHTSVLVEYTDTFVVFCDTNMISQMGENHLALRQASVTAIPISLRKHPQPFRDPASRHNRNVNS